MGEETSAIYTRDSDAGAVLKDTADYAVNGDIADHSETAGDTSSQSYTYDQLGRLAGSDDLGGDGSCLRHVYGYDGNSNRTSLTTSLSAPGAACTDTGATGLLDERAVLTATSHAGSPRVRPALAGRRGSG
ncbi:hypothetical protein [Actinacidiphila paucisporea]|uniref:YD repeat-containing protein n=1 Tax=Actinacidiphila paucisporea TaxID=310782 RepID=A0A1M7MKA3_9ACTN|nr:hypothetical protein [Actinacidiphila paucisporea]SHM91345.1 YD repeat-containing protein [Actinacidiphila paucisporea]